MSEENVTSFYEESEEDIYQVRDEELSSKEGNYIFTIGNVSSGKSTIQNLLLYRLWSKEDIVFEYGNHISDHRHNAIVQEWISSINQGILPKRTQQGLIQEFNISIGQKGKKKLDVNFIEISGEDIKSIVPTLSPDKKPSVHKYLDRYLMANNKINKRFIFISDGEKHKKGIQTIDSAVSEDILFDAFLKYLLSKTQKGLKNLNILFVISKWDTVREDYKNDEVKYFRENFPQTKSILDGSRVASMLLPFTIGKIDEVLIDKEKHLYENRIVSLENIYIDRLIQWIYNTFTNETLSGMPPIKPPLLYRIARTLGIR
jgi:hypothetical protein